MSTNGMTSWAVDLKDVGAIYPFQGSETFLVIVGLAFWIGWHIWQIKHENAELEAEKEKAKGEAVKKAIDRY
jgi:hypothetical protein